MAEQQLNAPPRAQQADRRAGVTHIRHRHTERFTVVGNHLAQHTELSLTARGLALYIQSRHDGVIISIKALAARFPEGEIAIARALRELEAHGYLARVQERTASGHRITRTYSYDHPEQRAHARLPKPRPAPPRAEAQPAAEPACDPAARRAIPLLGSLRARDPRLLLSERDACRLAPALTAWLDRGVDPDAALRTLAADLPSGPVRRPAGLIAYRLTHWLPPALPVAPPPQRRPAPHPFQTCPTCDRAFRAPTPGHCRDCLPAAAA